MQHLHYGAAIDRPETTNTTLPPIPEVVCQQPQETHLSNFHEIPKTATHENITCPNSNREIMQNHKRRQKRNLTLSIRIQHRIPTRKSGWEYATTVPQ